MWDLPNEDEYWERRREELENPKRGSPWNEPELEYEKGTLYLDEEIEDIEAEYGYPIEELTEGDLQDIVEKVAGVESVSAEWDENYYCISYKYCA